MENKNNWFDIWFEDKQSMLNIMVSNLTADLNAGYSYFGNSIKVQQKEIDKYKEDFDNQMKEFRVWEMPKIQHWCYFDLKRRGVIS